MHVLHRPRLPRLISVSIVAAIVATVVSLALASSLSNMGQPANFTSMSAHRAAPALTGALRATVRGAASTPFISVFGPPLPPPWLTAQR
jgi:hypothetical protein